MQALLVLLVVLLGATAVAAPADSVNLDDVMHFGQQWLQDNLDDEALAALGELDQAQLTRLCQAVQAQLRGDSVVDLAELQRLAGALLPVLDKYEETQLYAAWLKSRLDYLSVAGQFQPVAPLPPSQPIPNPGPQAERQAWQKQLAQRPLPGAAREYVARLKPIFAAQGVPPALVWLAEVESSFDPRARSPVGAAGLFQLMPATAQSLGLRLRPQDERMQPEASARAAAKYLGHLHGKFKDWRLALAAYNVGEGRLRALLNKHRATTFDEIATRLPAETQMYVPKIEATLQRREGVRLSQLSLPKPSAQ